MKKGNVEDIFIGYNDNHKRKKSKKGIIIIFIMLILVLTGMVSAYFYFTNQVVTKKQIFINSISSTNIKKFLENNIYSEIENRVLNENSETETKVNFSTTQESEELQGIDLANAELNLINKNDINNSKSYNELGLSYSGNEVFKVKSQFSEDSIAIVSDEIVDRYIGIHYDKIEEVFGIEFNKEDLDKLKKSEKIDLAEEEKSEYLKTYVAKFFENISEDKFTSQDNIVINKNNESVDVVAYSLKLSEEEFNDIIVNVLTTLKNDENLLRKIVTENSTTSSDKMQNTVEENNTIVNTTDNTIVPSFESDDSAINLYDQTDSSEQILTPNEENFNSSIELDADEFQTNLEDVTSINNDTSTSKEENKILSEIILSIIFNKKMDATVQELQSEIENLIDKANELEGSGINITVYVSKSGTEKVSLVLPSEDTIDIEFTKNPDDENNNTIQITCLYKNNDNSNSNNDGIQTYSAEDNISNNVEANTDKKDGFTLSLNKISKEAGVSLKATCGIINKEEINQKIDLEIKTNGSKNSKTIDNDVVMIFRTDEDETKVIIENKINFELSSNIDDLNSDNCVFLDDLSEEERTQLLMAIMERVMAVYQEKREELKIIDSNAGTSVIQQNNLDNISSTVTKEEAKNALFNRVSIMMGEAQNNNEEFTIQNLENLQIEGYEVSSTVTEEAAIIVVDTYTFRITPNFELLED